MLRKLSIAILVAALTTVGVVIPDVYLDKFVSLFIGDAQSANMVWDSNTRNYVSLANMPWPVMHHDFRCDWYCVCPSRTQMAKTSVEALRPSSAHSSVDRFGASVIEAPNAVALL